MPINAFNYLDQLGQERYRSIIVHASPEKNPSLTLFCQKISEQTNGKYLDLLELFIQSKQLSENIDSFRPEKLRGLLIEQSKAQSLLIVDRIDFLLDTWTKTERQDFYRLITDQWDSFKDGMKSKLIIGLQTSQEIGTKKILDSHGQSRIFQLTDFNDIG
jgi:hypothetical protein